MNSIITIFEDSGLLHDRFFNESFALPYSFDDIKIQSNELVTYQAVNQSLEKLYHNFLYLYSLTKLGSNIVPVGLSYYSGVSSGNTFTQYPSSASQTGFTPFSAVGLSYFDTATISKVVYSDLRGGPLMVTCSPSAVILTQAPSGTGTTYTVLLSARTVSTDSTLEFSRITNALINQQYLYIVDNGYNTIYKYNLGGFLSDSSMPAVLHIEQAVGGLGNYQDKYKFNSVTSICALDQSLYVCDSQNFAIKQYDLNFNFERVYHLRTIFSSDPALQIVADQFSKKIITLTQQRVVVFDSTFTSHTEVYLSKFFEPGETAISLFTLKSYTNFFFVTSNRRIYKFYTSKPQNLVGKYTLYRFNTSTSTVIHDADSVIHSSEEFDHVYTLASLNGIKRFIILKDDANYVDTLRQSDFQVFTLDDIKVNAGEYAQTWVFNKAISKLLLNHIRLKDQIIGRFYGKYDSQNNIILEGFTYFLLDDLDLTAYDITLEHFAGNNEALTNTAINRGLEKIFDIQQKIVEKSDTPIYSSSTFDSTPVTI